MTVTVLGVALANWPKFPRDTILEFNESLTILLISVLFIILAARVELESLLSVGFAGLVLLAIVMFVAPTLICLGHRLIGSNLKTNEKLMISWIGPRGIVAAAISSLFAIRLQVVLISRCGAACALSIHGHYWHGYDSGLGGKNSRQLAGCP